MLLIRVLLIRVLLIRVLLIRVLLIRVLSRWNPSWMTDEIDYGFDESRQEIKEDGRGHQAEQKMDQAYASRRE